MVPKEETRGYNPFLKKSTEPGEELVITGISGRFPESNNMKEFCDNLMNKVDLITEDDRRWTLDHPEVPHRVGKINNLSKFDASFFNVHFKQAHTMDPMCRILMEHAYEAIIDAGVNPKSLKGKNIGVFVGACFSESEMTWVYEGKGVQAHGLGLIGCSRSMLANEISYYLGIKGPSYNIDSACSSSLFAMEHAYRAIRTGQCDAAIVGGSNLCLHPSVSLQFARLGVLSPDGRSKSFDASADGYARSETTGAVFIQKAKDAKRIYATFVHGKSNCDGFKEQGITFPSTMVQRTLLREFYEECKVPTTSLALLEAHGTGTRVGDPEELNAAAAVFCPGRKQPLKIGSVKSNIGHAEAASGMGQVAKVIIAFETGKIPPNLHYKMPREGIEALADGRLQVVTEPTPWCPDYTGISSFGFGGANAHILLKPNSKQKVDGGAPRDSLPRLVTISGRTEEAVDSILSDVEGRPIDVEYIRLLHEIFAEDLPQHPYRGYTIVQTSPSKIKLREIKHYSEKKPPVWFIFSGLGSDWVTTVTSLWSIPIFVNSISKCDAILKLQGYDLLSTVQNLNKAVSNNVLNSFVGIAAVQIALVDVLTALKITPDGIIGFSIGELACAYADGCLTTEQVILAAYFTGLMLTETDIIEGSMATVDVGYEKLTSLCPSDIDIAWHNSANSSIISGPADSVKAFIAKLKTDNIFARELPCNNIAYHSKCIAEVGRKLFPYLRKIIPQPKTRSSKWISTSVAERYWNLPQAKLASAEYYINNLLSSVLFGETSKFIPKNAIIIKIVPDRFLENIMKKSRAPKITNIALIESGYGDNCMAFLHNMGKLYAAGLQPAIWKLYPDVEFPVSRGTPSISHLIKWDHSDDWFVTKHTMQEKIETGERTVELVLSKEAYEYMAGHVIDGRNLLPATGYLALIWETVGMMRGQVYTEVPIVFEDVKFLRATTVSPDITLKITLMVQKGTGRFEVIEGGVAVVTGRVRHTENAEQEQILFPRVSDDEPEEMTSKDVYKELRLRGYQYSGLFKGIKSATTTGSKATVRWDDNWVAFMDNMLQVKILGVDTRNLLVPTGIQKLTVDTKKHLQLLRAMTYNTRECKVYTNNKYDIIACGGIQIRGLKASAISRRKVMAEPVLECYNFVAHNDQADIDFKQAIRLATHLALENNLSVKIKTLELLNAEEEYAKDELFSTFIAETLADLPMIQADVNIATSQNDLNLEELPFNINILDLKKLTPESGTLILAGKNLLAPENSESVGDFLLNLKAGNFVMSLESSHSANIAAFLSTYQFHIIFKKTVNGAKFLLLRKLNKIPNNKVIIQVNNEEFAWIHDLKTAVKKEIERPGSSRIVLVSDKSFENGLLGLVNCLRREPGGEVVRGILIQDTNAPDFSLSEPTYADQLNLDLAINVLRPKGTWGSYRHHQLSSCQPRPFYHAWANQIVKGDLTSFQWMEGPITPECKDDVVRVVYSSINFKDVMLATGKLATIITGENRAQAECVLGFEYAGITKSGRRVMGMVNYRAMTNALILDKDLSWTVPDTWTLEEAATVPCVYATSYYALYVRGGMKKGDKVLIHAGSGGVGQAAITLALWTGCEVFTTVGTAEKKSFIIERFPQIPEDHIGNSRDTSFEQMIMQCTNGTGVDLVLNSLADDKLQASVRCLAHGGKFLEIGKYDMTNDSPLGMSAFIREISFHGVLLDKLFDAAQCKKKELHSIMQKGLDTGAIKPLNVTVFPRDQIEAAFRYMAAGKHIGKVILKIQDEKNLGTLVPALPRYHCLKDCSYLILGALGGFGLELCDWLVLRGAKNLILTSRTGIKNGYQRMRIDVWKNYGTKVTIITGKDASNVKDCEEILSIASKEAPIDAIFNLAVVLKDNLLENQTPESFEESFRAKAWSTKNLDKLSRAMCSKLRHFVVFSSVSCGRGNAGQTNYGMSNSVMERICEKRAAEGLPALAIQWGAIGDVGLVADMQDDDKELVIGGTLQQKIISCLHELDGFLNQRSPIVASMVVAEKKAGSSEALNIVETVLNIMNLKDLKSISQHTPLAEIGMDSMMAVEIKQTLEREFEVFLTAQDIRGLNFAKLLDMNVTGAPQKLENGVSEEENITRMHLLAKLLGQYKGTKDIYMKLATKEQAGKNEIFFIPGIEGFAAVFENLAGHIKAPASCFQFHSTDTQDTSIPRMAEKLLPYILERSKERAEITICGFSFGTIIAIELARKLETLGRIVKLIFIDGSPEYTKSVKQQLISSNYNIEFDTSLLINMGTVIAPTIVDKLSAELKNCKSWEEKLDIFIQMVPTDAIAPTPEEAKKFCTSFYKRILAVQNYDISKTPPLKSSITLLRASDPIVRMSTPDYGLSAVTTEKVQIYTFEGTHLTIIDNPKVAAIINGELLEDTDKTL